MIVRSVFSSRHLCEACRTQGVVHLLTSTVGDVFEHVPERNPVLKLLRVDPNFPHESSQFAKHLHGDATRMHVPESID